MDPRSTPMRCPARSAIAVTVPAWSARATMPSVDAKYGRLKSMMAARSGVTVSAAAATSIWPSRERVCQPLECKVLEQHFHAELCADGAHQRRVIAAELKSLVIILKRRVVCCCADHKASIFPDALPVTCRIWCDERRHRRRCGSCSAGAIGCWLHRRARSKQHGRKQQAVAASLAGRKWRCIGILSKCRCAKSAYWAYRHMCMATVPV